MVKEKVPIDAVQNLTGSEDGNVGLSFHHFSPDWNILTFWSFMVPRE